MSWNIKITQILDGKKTSDNIKRHHGCCGCEPSPSMFSPFSSFGKRSSSEDCGTFCLHAELTPE